MGAGSEAQLAQRVKVFSLSQYVETAVRLAKYEKDEDGLTVARVPQAQGFFAQGDSEEEARANLEDVVEGNILLALQLGWDIPRLPGVTIEERDVETRSA